MSGNTGKKTTAKPRAGQTGSNQRNPNGITAARKEIRELNERISSLTETNRQLKRKIFDLYTIFEISRNFNAVLDYQTLLDTFILTSLAQVGASKAAIFLPREGHPEKMVMAKSRGSGRFPDRRQYFKAGSKLVTYINRLNRPVPTGELTGKLALRGEASILGRFHPGLVVPLIYQSRLTGIFVISDKISGRQFQMEDIEFLSVLGNQIAVAIENVRLYEAEKAASMQLRAAQAQLVQTERHAALGDMSARVAHEINNPLGIIKNYIQLIKRSMGKNIEAANYTDIVGQEIDRIAHIVRQLLNLHRPERPSFSRIDAFRVVEEVLVLMERTMESKHIAVEKNLKVEQPFVEGSPDNLKQVFLNIIINAADVMPSGGTLKVSGTVLNNKLMLEFCDTGPGIPPEVIPRIFEPFFTTKEPGQGTGLGLSVCYGIIKNHLGSIRYSNTRTGGCFAISLPLSHEDSD